MSIPIQLDLVKIFTRLPGDTGSVLARASTVRAKLAVALRCFLIKTLQHVHEIINTSS